MNLKIKSVQNIIFSSVIDSSDISYKWLAIKLTDLVKDIASYNFHSSNAYSGKGIICSCITLTSTTVVIIIHISKKNKQNNGQKKKGQTTIYKTHT
jgi:hypothetical protein